MNQEDRGFSVMSKSEEDRLNELFFGAEKTLRTSMRYFEGALTRHTKTRMKIILANIQKGSLDHRLIVMAIKGDPLIYIHEDDFIVNKDGSLSLSDSTRREIIPYAKDHIERLKVLCMDAGISDASYLEDIKIIDELEAEYKEMNS